MVTRRVFVSSTSNKTLDERRRLLKAAILNKVRDAGFELQEFWESGVPENLAWSFENVDRVMRKCVGAVIMGFSRWTTSSSIRLIGEYNHYEGAVALSHGVPVFLLAERGVENRGVVWTGGGKTITYIPEGANASWVEEPDFDRRLNA